MVLLVLKEMYVTLLYVRYDLMSPYILQAHDLAANNDTMLLVVIPATSCRDVAVSRALKLAQELDSECEWRWRSNLYCRANMHFVEA